MQFQEKSLDKDYLENMNSHIKMLEKDRVSVKKKLEELYVELQALKKEIPKIILGKSKFSEDIINEINR